jgi:hypothetical protein
MTERSYKFDWGSTPTDDRIAIDIEAGDHWADEYDELVALIEDLIEPKVDGESERLETPLITRKMKDARVYHTMRCQYVRRGSPSRTQELTDRLQRTHDFEECEYCRAKRLDDVDDPRNGVEQDETAAALRDADPDAIGGD